MLPARHASRVWRATATSEELAHEIGKRNDPCRCAKRCHVHRLSFREFTVRRCHCSSAVDTRIRPMSREMALVAYRNLLRSARIAFQGTATLLLALDHSRNLPSLGDANVLSAARIEVRKNFESNRHLQTGSEEFQKQIAHAEEVSKFLRENVVQGEATEGDNYSMRRRAEAWMESLLTRTAEIRIHEHTERGDNEDIKKNKGKTTLGGTKCCSS